MNIFTLHPDDIKVADGLDRYRKELGDIKALGKSIKKVGQLLPILITEDYELVDGGRRIAACAELGININCVDHKKISQYELREMELEANLHRKDYTPAEYNLIIRDIHELKIKQNQASPKPQTYEATAKEIGISKASVINAIKNAKAIDMFPELKAAKTNKQITKAVKKLDQVQNAIAGLKEYKKLNEEKKDIYRLHQVDSYKFMETLPNAAIDILCTDPLYGIDHDKIIGDISGKTGGEHSINYKFDDNTKDALIMYEKLAKESYRFTTAKAHAYIFCGMEHFDGLKKLFQNAGWFVYIKPIIWTKQSTGRCTVPSNWPADCYEAIMFCRKPDSSLIIEGQPNWINQAPVSNSKKTHIYEKPVELIMNLLNRVSVPGQTLFDPFMGSGAIIEAAIKMKLIAIGCDNDLSAFSIASKRLNELVIT